MQEYLNHFQDGSMSQELWNNPGPILKFTKEACLLGHRLQVKADSHAFIQSFKY